MQIAGSLIASCTMLPVMCTLWLPRTEYACTGRTSSTWYFQTGQQWMQLWVSAPTSGGTAIQAKSYFACGTVEEKALPLLTWHCSMLGATMSCWVSGKPAMYAVQTCIAYPPCHSTPDADDRTEAHWQEVQRKKTKLADLRQQKSTADSELGSLISKHSSAQKKLNEFFYDPSPHSRYSSQVSHVNSLKVKVSSAQSVCSNLQRSIDATGKAPPPVIQPLPQNQSSALVWLFYMHMPSLLRQLSRASFLAQQLLLPVPEHGTDMDISTPSFFTNLLQHYNHYQQPSQYLSTPCTSPGFGGHVLLLSCGSVPQKVGPDHVDSFYYR
eukprot:1150315-Pelagomonas_calceolata.AAC.1